MTVWEITNRWVSDVAGVTHADDIEFDPMGSFAFWSQFEGLGSSLQWNTRPRLATIEYEGRRKRRPRADVSPFASPGLIVNAKVHDALGEILSRFGQLLEVDVDEQIEYYYNATNMLDCLDRESSEVEAYYVERPVFHENLIPPSPVIFVERALAGRIFVNEGAKKILENGIAETGITGMSFQLRGCE